MKNPAMHLAPADHHDRPVASCIDPVICQYLDAVPVEIIILNKEGIIIFANRTYLAYKNADTLNRMHFKEVTTDSLLVNSQLEKHFEHCRQTGSCEILSEIKYESSQQMEKTVTINISPIPQGDEHIFMVIFNYTTEMEEIRFQLEIIRELGFFMVGTVDLEKLLFLILTGVTAGPALGFNRAFILLTDEKTNSLNGGMGVGPTSAEEAGRIWERVSSEKRQLKDFLSEYELFPDKAQIPVSVISKQLECSLDDAENILVQTVRKKEIIHIQKASSDKRVSRQFHDIYRAEEFITAPLIAEEEVVGVLIADNMFNNQPISQKHMSFLEFFVYLAGITIKNASRHFLLQDTITQLKNIFQQLNEADIARSEMEQFATVGRTAGFVAHEIRNPLTTIGGFARSTLKHIDDQEKVVRNSKIIVSEVKRLEVLLKNVLDYLRKPDPVINPTDINGILNDTLLLVEEQALEKNISLEQRKSDNLPKISCDAQLIKQALLNLLQNAIYFTPANEKVEVETLLINDKLAVRIIDHGQGISPQNMEKLFTPFFTTKDVGTGLGLSITKRIIDSHHGEIEFNSELDKGTTVEIALPIN